MVNMDEDGKIVELAPNDAYAFRCCEIFMTKLGRLIFHCSRCEGIYGTFPEFIKHIVNVHNYRPAIGVLAKSKVQSTAGTKSVGPAKLVAKTEEQFKCNHCQRTFKYSCHFNLHECEASKVKSQVSYPCSETTQLFRKLKSKSTSLKCIRETSSEVNSQFNIKEDSQANYRIDWNDESRGSNDDDWKMQQPEEDLDFFTIKKTRRRFKPFPCPKCSYQYSEKRLLEKHYDACHAKKQRFQCKLCNSTLANKGNMISHLRRHFDSTKRFKCSMCDSKFHTRIERRVHEYRHTGERPYICAVCGERFITNSRLKEHMRRHNNERLFKCEHCDKSFFTGRVMRDHMMVHATELTHECTLCNAKFKTIKTLKNHIKLHENKREYVCNICGMGFNQRPALVLHKRGKHKLLPIGAPAQKGPETDANEHTT